MSKIFGKKSVSWYYKGHFNKIMVNYYLFLDVSFFSKEKQYFIMKFYQESHFNNYINFNSQDGRNTRNIEKMNKINYVLLRKL